MILRAKGCWGGAGVLAKACDYTLTIWSRLSRFLEYPELELSNNLAETRFVRSVSAGEIGYTSEVKRLDQ